MALSEIDRFIAMPSIPDRVVVYTGTQNPRRQVLIHHLEEHPQAIHLAYHIGEEPQADVLNVVHVKIARAVRGLQEYPFIRRARSVVYVAADVQQQVGRNPGFGTENLGKPKGPKAVQRVFEQMLRASEDDGKPPGYVIAAGAGVLTVEPGKTSLAKNSAYSGVILDPSVINRFTTRKGFREYQAGLTDFYDSPAYKSEISQKADLTTIAAGLSLGTLASMGAVTRIDDASVTDAKFPLNLRRGLQLALTGMTEVVPLQMRSQKKIEEWPWLNAVTEHAMKNVMLNRQVNLDSQPTIHLPAVTTSMRPGYAYVVRER
jgi:hypothetical protein